VSPADDLPVVPFPSAADWEAWLDEHHAGAAGVWVQIAKKSTGIPTVTYAQAVDAAICFGWIDGRRAGMDETWFLQRFTPRRARSRWSKINTEKALAFIEQGRMRPAGLAEVERAQADGRWEAAYDGQKAMQVPEDLRAALAAEPGALEFFQTLRGQNRYAILYRVHDARRPETRARRIATFVAMCAAGETVH